MHAGIARGNNPSLFVQHWLQIAKQEDDLAQIKRTALQQISSDIRNALAEEDN